MRCPCLSLPLPARRLRGVPSPSDPGLVMPRLRRASCRATESRRDQCPARFPCRAIPCQALPFRSVPSPAVPLLALPSLALRGHATRRTVSRGRETTEVARAFLASHRHAVPLISAVRPAALFRSAPDPGLACLIQSRLGTTWHVVPSRDPTEVGRAFLALLSAAVPRNAAPGRCPPDRAWCRLVSSSPRRTSRRGSVRSAGATCRGRRCLLGPGIAASPRRGWSPCHR